MQNSRIKFHKQNPTPEFHKQTSEKLYKQNLE